MRADAHGASLARQQPVHQRAQIGHEAVMAHERWERLGRLLESFTARDRRFVDLYFSRGMAPEAVAEAMNISVKTVYSKKNKIRVKLERMTRRLPAIANDNDAGLPLAA